MTRKRHSKAQKRKSTKRPQIKCLINSCMAWNLSGLMEISIAKQIIIIHYSIKPKPYYELLWGLEMWYIYPVCSNSKWLLSMFSHWFHLKVLNHVSLHVHLLIHMYMITYKITRHFFYDVKCRLSVVPFEKLRAMGIKSCIMLFYVDIISSRRLCCKDWIKA